jgi:hypothetical protein
MTTAKTDRWIAMGLFVLALVTYAWWDPGPGWNQNANFDLARSMVERQTFNIDGYHVNTRDTSVGRRGQIYSNKPPGLSMLAAIPYAVVYRVESARGISVDDLRVMRINLWIVTAATCGVSGALLAALLYLYGRRRAGVSPLASLSVAFLIAFATIVFAYSTVLFAHVPSALLLFLAFAWLDEKPFLSGFAAGLSSLCFYFSIPLALVLTVAAFLKSRRHALLIIAGGAPAACFLAFYQYRCFGSVFRTSSELSKRFTTEGLLLGMFHGPKLEAFWGTTFSPYRGLFFLSPVLLFALVGAFVMIRSGRMRRELNVAAALVAVLLFLVACYSWWDGGWAIGPRFLLQAIPLLAVPMFFATGMLRPLWIVAGLVSLVFNFTAIAVDPMPSHAIANPIRDYILPAFFRGSLPDATRAALQRTDPMIGHVGLSLAGTNMGEYLFEPGSLMTVVPIAVWMTAGFALLCLVASRARHGD